MVCVVITNANTSMKNLNFFVFEKKQKNNKKQKKKKKKKMGRWC